MQEPAETNPAHRNQVERPAQWNEVRHPAHSFTQFIDDAHLDVTLPRTRMVPCPRCKGTEAVYYEVSSLLFYLTNISTSSIRMSNTVTNNVKCNSRIIL